MSLRSHLLEEGGDEGDITKVRRCWQSFDVLQILLQAVAHLVLHGCAPDTP